MNDRPLFRPFLSSGDKLPWFDRRILKELTQFGPDQRDGFTVYVTPEAVIDFHKGTLYQAPLEAFGLLMGRVYEDELGSFTVVARAFYASKPDASSNHIHLSPNEMYQLRTQASRLSPTMDFVGWTHSHQSVSEYSPVDYQEQKTWKEDYHIGILTFMNIIKEASDAAWAIAYRGQSAQMLPLVIDSAPVLRKNNMLSSAPKARTKTQVSSTFTGERPNIQANSFPRETQATEGLSFSEKQLQDSSQGGEAQFSPSRKAKARKPLSKWFRFRSAIGLLLQLVLMFAIVIIGVMLGNWLSFRFQQPSPTLPSTTFLWDCNQQNGKAPLSVTCTGPVGPNIQGWIWDFGDGTMMQKSIVTHVYQKPGTYKITLTVTSSANQHTSTYNSNAGSYTIEVKP